jgi:hypothetical protein
MSPPRTDDSNFGRKRSRSADISAHPADSPRQFDIPVAGQEIGLVKSVFQRGQPFEVRATGVAHRLFAVPAGIVFAFTYTGRWKAIALSSVGIIRA